MKRMSIGILISLVGLYIAFHKIDATALAKVIIEADWAWVILGVGFLLFSVWLRAVRWKILMEPVKSVKLMPLFSTTMIGYFGNGILPLRLGELLRAYSLHKEDKSISAAAAFGTIVVERLLDLVGLLVLSIVIFTLYDVPRWLLNAGILLGITVIGSFILFWWISASHQEWVKRIENFALLQRGIGVKIRYLLHSFIEGIIALRKTHHFGLLVLYSAILWVIYLGITKASAMALNISLTWIEVGIILAATTMVISIPSAPGYVGTYHAAAVLIMAEIFGKSEISSQAFAILNHAIGFLPLVIVGFFFFIQSSVGLGDIRGLRLKPRISDNGKPVIFLDRDGTLNPDPGYISSLDQFKFYDHTLDVLEDHAKNGFRFVVVTNQSGVGRGIISYGVLEEIHDYVRSSFRNHNIPLLGIYYCPHRPDEGCDCRKPGPGMFRRAAKEHTISLETSYIIGDSIRDMEAGILLGMTTILVRTGNGRSSEKSLSDKGIQIDFIGNTLQQCTQFILDKELEW